MVRKRTNSAPSAGGVNLVGHLSGGFGIARAAQYCVAEIEKSGLPYCLKNITAQTQTEESHRYAFVNKLRYPVSLLLCNADGVKGCQTQLAAEKNLARYDIGAWWWELEEFPDYFRSAFAVVDEVWARTDFVYRAIKRVSPVPVIRMPFTYVPPAVRVRRSRTKRPFTFVFIFDHTSDFERKNPCAVVAAFKKAFPTTTDARLIIKSMDGHKYPLQHTTLLTHAGDDRRIEIIDASWPKDRLYQLLYDADVFVSLHRSEGLGQNILDALYYGKPVIATAYSANMEYMPASYPFLVNYRMKRYATVQPSYPKTCLWADPDIAEAARHMRRIYTDYPSAQRSTKAIRDAVLRMSDPAKTAGAIKKRLSEIYAMLANAQFHPKKKTDLLGLVQMRDVLRRMRPKKVLVFSTARQERVAAIMTCVKKTLPRATIAVFGKVNPQLERRAAQYFTYTAVGNLSLDAIERSVWRRMRAFKPDCIIVPFFCYYGKSYGNVFRIVRALGVRRVIGVGSEGDVFPMRGKRVSQRRLRQ